jgi:ribosomal protein S18 acetylase RimI-like enzyme
MAAVRERPNTPLAAIGIRRAAPSEGGPVAQLLGAAFQDDPVGRWLFPDPVDRQRRQPGFFHPFVDFTLRYGEIWVVGPEPAVAAALWLEEDLIPHPVRDAQRAVTAKQLDGAIGPHLPRWRILAELLSAYHPRREPHAYLPFIAVRPDHQATGLATALLRHRFAELDANDRPAFLEASSPRTVALYRRLGFRPAGRAIELPAGPPMQPMWRDPAGS